MRPRGVTPEPQRSELLTTIRKAAKATSAWDAEVRAKVCAAHAAGGSVRDIAELTGKSTNTIGRWIKEGKG